MPVVFFFGLVCRTGPGVTRSDKRVTKVSVLGHSELLIPAENATKELSFDISFKTVHNAKLKLWSF